MGASARVSDRTRARKAGKSLLAMTGSIGRPPRRITCGRCFARSEYEVGYMGRNVSRSERSWVMIRASEVSYRVEVHSGHEREQQFCAASRTECSALHGPA